MGEDKARWDAYVHKHENGTFYHLSGWQEIIGDFLRHPTYYLYVERDGVINGVLPLARVKSRLFGDALISLPFLVYGGPLGSDAESTAQLIDEATRLATALGVDYLELRNRTPLTDWPAKSTYVTFRKAIAADPEENLNAIPRKQRAMVRKGIKFGLEAEFDADVGRLYSVLSECKRNLGTPFFSESYLRAIKAIFKEHCEILTVMNGKEPVASVMSFRFRDEILPYYGGGGGNARQLAANDFMYWKVMEAACQRGARVFDYGRSQEGMGPYHFKKNWGFEPEPLSYEYYLVNATEIPQLDPTNARFGAAIRIWSRLPLPIARIAGPPIARLLG